MRMRTLDLGLALGNLEKNPPADEDGAWWWTGHRALDLFLQRRDNLAWSSRSPSTRALPKWTAWRASSGSRKQKW